MSKVNETEPQINVEFKPSKVKIILGVVGMITGIILIILGLIV